MAQAVEVSRTDFDALASGGGGPAAIEVLWRGQLSKHIVMIRGVTQLGSAAEPDMAEALRAAYATLAAAQQRDSAAVATLLRHPAIGTWASRCLRRLTGAETGDVPLATELGQLAAIAAVAAIRAGHPCDLPVPRLRGAVMLPTLGLARFADATEPQGQARIIHDGHHTRLTTTDVEVTVPMEHTRDSLNWQGLRRLKSTAGGLTLAVEIDDLDPGRERLGQLSTRLDDAALAHWQGLLDDAWRVLTRHHPERAAELHVGLTTLVPLDPDGTGNGSSVSAQDAFGQVMTTPGADGRQLADTLIHEFQHSKLHGVTDLVPLNTAGGERRHYSPWRDDPRPLEGILHAVYSYLGVTEFWEVQRGLPDCPEPEFAEFEFHRWSRQLRATIHTLLDSGELTSDGVAFVQGMATRALRWTGLPGASRPRWFADLAIADHRVRWRIRHLRPDPEHVRDLAAAWRTGDLGARRHRTVNAPVPTDPNLALSGRLRLMVGLLKDPDRFAARCTDPQWLAAMGPSVDAADVALLSGDPEAALRGYERTLTGTDPERWAGWMLAWSVHETGHATGPLIDAPELLYTLHRQMRDDPTPPAPSALAAWFAALPGPDNPERPGLTATAVRPSRRGLAPRPATPQGSPPGSS
ncbi:HEXXH motif domain-containing protein [Dactylosporangium fulvum]|uniref:HEXXH motif domain-containing protein n=1 Tax=Dactylosporangium fulvum TaxID=53359 RepID=A0ABY5W5M3_9ACTN|nr:HEXXH motif domain-containing protein [Dactylosporangium fulvum]UWP85357.1 HEXXH motif domain-containing protein [Dactylosporangium fulvum]